MAQSALDLVITALKAIREKSEHAPRASKAILAGLEIIDSVIVSPQETSGPRHTQRLQPGSN
ncbi:MAG: hypothetical protein ACM3KL_04445, partial [Alphaproteobacteria bacterium]